MRAWPARMSGRHETLPMRLKLVSCEIFFREMCATVATSPHQIDIEFLPKGLHDIGSEGMLARLQEAVDRVDPLRHEALILGYALCNNGTRGLVARTVPIVIPRAHDCITLFFGSRQRYVDYFNANPGTYFKTSGWIERGNDTGEMRQLSIPHRTGMDLSYDELVEKYGEDNAQYLWANLCDPMRNYRQLTYIEMGVEPDDRFESETRREAEVRGWQYDKVRGDMVLFRRLCHGDWDDDFLVLQPGERVAVPLDDGILRAESAA